MFRTSCRLATLLWLRALALAGPPDPSGLEVPLDDLGELCALHEALACA